MKAAIVGYGALGIQLREFIEEQFSPTTILFFDDSIAPSENAFPFQDYGNNKFKDFSFFLGIGYKHLGLKRQIINELISRGRSLPNLIHPTCFVSKKAQLSEACYLYPMCNVDIHTKLYQGCLLNNSVTVSHNSTVGACSYLSPGVIVSGNVEIGDRVFLGSGSVVSNSVNIGNDTIIGLNTSVTKNIPEHSYAIGNPLQLKTRINLS